MSFASRFPTVARLLGSTAGAGADQDPPADPPADDNGDDQDQGGDDQDQGDDAGNGGGEDQARASAPDRKALEAAFTKDAAALVAKERERCIKVFTSDEGKRSPVAAGKLLERAPNLSADDTIDTLKDVGSSASSGPNDRRQAHRDRINESRDTRVNTGEGEDGATRREATLKKVKEDRKRRNDQHAKKGAVKADRREFDMAD